MKNNRNTLYILVLIFALIIESILMTGCAQNFQASPLESSREDSEILDAAIVPVSSGLLIYENSAYNFRIGYSEDWQAREADPNNIGLVYGMLPPEEDANNPLNYLVVQVEVLPSGATLDQYTQGLIQTMKQSNSNLRMCLATQL
jgi:hypothetical protein